MAFLAPAFLALGLLAGVPLLVHLLRRRVGRVIDFPAVRYLERMEQE
ncbi:MAG: BatA domain-containing protein, partial [Gemmatimonas sp.]